MTNAQMEAIFKNNIPISLPAALRSVWNAGYYEGKGTTPTSTSADKSWDAAKPVAFILCKK